jgi:hypothetical protein
MTATHFRLAVLSSIFLALTLPQNKKQDSPTLSKDPLSTEHIEVYGAFLDGYLTSEQRRSISLSDQTFPLEFDEMDHGGNCLNGVVMENLAAVAKAIHSFGPEIAKGRNLVLVDRKRHALKDPGKAIKNGESVDRAVEAGFAAGVLSLSEMAFDKSHEHAALKFSFICGGLCGHGGTALLEKNKDGWKEIHNSCGRWIS